MVSLFFVGLYTPFSMQSMGAISTVSVANQVRKATNAFLSALKTGKTVVIRAALIALLIVLASQAKKHKLLPGMQQPQIEYSSFMQTTTTEVPQEPEMAMPQPSLLQKEFGQLLNNYYGDVNRFITILNKIVSTGEKLDTTIINGIGQSPIAQNSQNKEILKKFLLDRTNIERIYASKDAAKEAGSLFGPDLYFNRDVDSSNLPDSD